MKKRKFGAALFRSQGIAAKRANTLARLHSDFGKWVEKNCMGWRSGVLTPDFNYKKHCKRFTCVTVGFKFYLVDDHALPKKYHAVIGVYKAHQRNRNYAFVPEVLGQGPTVGSIMARNFVSGEAHV